MIVHLTNIVLVSSVKTPVLSQILMCVDKVLTVRPPTTKLSVLALRASLETHLSAADRLRRKTCATLFPVDLVLNVRLGLTDLELIDQCAPVLLATGEIHLLVVNEVNVSMIASVRWTKLATISTAGHPVRMPVVRMLSARQGIMVPSVLVPQDSSEILSLRVVKQDDSKPMSLDSPGSRGVFIHSSFSPLKIKLFQVR
jgi:hypothetical protein